MPVQATPGWERGRPLTDGERDEFRHYLQVLMENARLVRNAIEPTGHMVVTTGQWRSQWAAIKKDLDFLTEQLG